MVAKGSGRGPEQVAAARQGPPRPNFLVILTDDQHDSNLRSMPIVRRRLVGRGVRFTNGFVADPLCCPSRTALLTGSYAHTNGVYWNGGRHGGVHGFNENGNEARSLGPLLRSAGYRTGLIGKYLNDLRRTVGRRYVPPGWDRFVSFYENNGAYYDYDLTVDGAIRHRGSGTDDYSTDVLRRHAVRFLQRESSAPFFLLFAPFASHGPATPARRHTGDLRRAPAYSSPALNESDVSDKPPYIRSIPRLSSDTIAAIQRDRIQEMESLLAVDEAVGSFLDVLRETGELRRTVIVFLSDNGLGWGDHRWTFKAVPYEGSIAVPYVVRYDPLTRSRTGRSDARLVLNIDLAPTFLELAGMTPRRWFDGRSLVPLLRGGSSGLRRSFLIEHLFFSRGPLGSVPSYCAVRSERWKYVVYRGGFRELYDLRNDPFELSNVARSRRGVRRQLHARLRVLCDPPPPGSSLP
jgi:N-acetylglucosamine-6-sulfatase